MGQCRPIAFPAFIVMAVFGYCEAGVLEMLWQVLGGVQAAFLGLGREGFFDDEEAAFGTEDSVDFSQAGLDIVPVNCGVIGQSQRDDAARERDAGGLGFIEIDAGQELSSGIYHEGHRIDAHGADRFFLGEGGFYGGSAPATDVQQEFVRRQVDMGQPEPVQRVMAVFLQIGLRRSIVPDFVHRVLPKPMCRIGTICPLAKPRTWG